MQETDNINKINASCASITMATQKGALIQAERKRWRHTSWRCARVCVLRHVWLLAIPGTVGRQAPSVYGIILARKYWMGYYFFLRVFTDVGIEQESPVSPGLAGIRDQISNLSKLCRLWLVQVQKMLNFCLHTRMLPSTIGDVIWRSLKMSVFVNLNKSKMTNKKGKWGHNTLPAFTVMVFCLQDPRFSSLPNSKDLANSSLCAQQLTRVSSNFDDEQCRAPSGSDPSLRAFVFCLWIRSKRLFLSSHLMEVRNI